MVSTQMSTTATTLSMAFKLEDDELQLPSTFTLEVLVVLGDDSDDPNAQECKWASWAIHNDSSGAYVLQCLSLWDYVV